MEHSQPWGWALHRLDAWPSTSQEELWGGGGKRSSPSVPSPQPSSSVRFCCPPSGYQAQPVSLPPNHIVSDPSHLQHPSSYSNVSQNSVPSVFLPNPSKHSHFLLLKPTTDSSPDDTGHQPHRARSSEQTTALLPKSAGVQPTQCSHGDPTTCFLGCSRAAGATRGLPKLGRSRILPALSQPSPWPLQSSNLRTSPDQQPAQHLHTFFTPPMSHILPGLVGAPITR